MCRPVRCPGSPRSSGSPRVRPRTKSRSMRPRRRRVATSVWRWAPAPPTTPRVAPAGGVPEVLWCGRRCRPPASRSRTTRRVRSRPALRAGALEVLGLGVLFALLPQLAEARSGVMLEPHPGWIAVLVLAARYGSGGLFAGLVTAAGAILGATAIAGTGLSSVWKGLDSTPSLIAFGGCLIVSWIASWHLRREAELSRQLDTLRDRSREARAEFQTLSDAVATLRARVDRTSTSLSFLRDVARRLEGRDPVAAAEAAADRSEEHTPELQSPPQ